MAISIAENKDCMIAMKEFPDKFFDLAIVDPPYGGGQKFNFRFRDENGSDGYENVAPPIEYFNELFRVSKNQIIWGGNYFTDKIPVNRCWLCWYKGQPIKDFSDIELAWTSFDKTSRHIDLKSYGFRHSDKAHGKEKTIHPTQKPILLYTWLLKNFANVGNKILDTHLGSGSSRIAAFNAGLDFWSYEKDKEYFHAQEKRFNNGQDNTMFGNVSNHKPLNLF